MNKFNPYPLSFYHVYNFYKRTTRTKDADIYAYSFCILLFCMNLLGILLWSEILLNTALLPVARWPEKLLYMLALSVPLILLYYYLDRRNALEKIVAKISGYSSQEKKLGRIVFYVYFLLSVFIIVTGILYR